MTIRMVLAHPRSRSNLLCASYDDYTTELFSPVYIQTTKFYKENRHLMQKAQFADAYLDHLRETYDGKSFTFKVHHCSAMWWPGAQKLIAEWRPTQVIEVYRSDKQAALLSYLLARHFGYVSQEGKKAEPFEVDAITYAAALSDIRTQWVHGLHVDQTVEFEEVPEFIRVKNQLDGHAYSNLQIRSRLENQNSQSLYSYITNLHEVREWMNRDSNLLAVPPHYSTW